MSTEGIWQLCKMQRKRTYSLRLIHQSDIEGYFPYNYMMNDRN